MVIKLKLPPFNEQLNYRDDGNEYKTAGNGVFLVLPFMNFSFSESKMNPTKVCVTLALAVCALGPATAQLITIAAAGTAIAAGSVVLTPVAATAIGAAIIGGGAILKGLAIAGIAGGIGAGVGSRRNGLFGRRGRRQAGEPTGAVESVVPADNAAFALVASTEPSQCYRRLICNLATGSMKHTELDIIPQFLSMKEVDIESPEFEFANAAKLGSTLKNVKACEVRYSCPLSSEEIAKLF